MAIFKFSNAGGFGTYTRYNDFLAGNITFVPDSGSMFPIGAFNLTSAQSTVTFSNIPQTFDHLQIRLIARSTTAAASANSFLTFNGNSGSNYASHILRGDGASTPTSGAYTSQTFIYSAEIPAASATTGIFGPAIIDVLDYRSTSKNKTVRQLHGHDRNGAGAIVFASGLFFATPAAITSLTFTTTGNFDINSNFALYGVKG